MSTQRKSQAAFPSSGLSLQCETYFANTHNPVNNDANKGNRCCEENRSGTKTVWNRSLPEPKNKNQTGRPSWSKQTNFNKQVQAAERTVENVSSGDNAFGGNKVGRWNKTGMGNYRNSSFPQNDMTGTFVAGRGSGGRRGRGGVRGGRNQSGRGRTSSMNPFNWNGGEDKGGYGGRGGLNRIGGNFRGRGQSSLRGRRGGAGYDRGGFRGRGKLEREGGFGGRGLGNSEWINKHNLAFGRDDYERSSRGCFYRGGGRSQRGSFGGHGRSDQSSTSGISVGAASGWRRQVSDQTNQRWVWNTGEDLGKGGAVDQRGKAAAAAASSGKGYGGGGKAVW